MLGVCHLPMASAAAGLTRRLPFVPEILRESLPFRSDIYDPELRVVLKLLRDSTDRRLERRGVVLLGCALTLSVDDLDNDYHCVVLPPTVATCSTYN
jgi:hypothetical protein